MLINAVNVVVELLVKMCRCRQLLKAAKSYIFIDFMFVLLLFGLYKYYRRLANPVIPRSFYILMFLRIHYSLPTAF